MQCSVHWYLSVVLLQHRLAWHKPTPLALPVLPLTVRGTRLLATRAADSRWIEGAGQLKQPHNERPCLQEALLWLDCSYFPVASCCSTASMSDARVQPKATNNNWGSLCSRCTGRSLWPGRWLFNFSLKLILGLCGVCNNSGTAVAAPTSFSNQCFKVGRPIL